MRYVVLSSHYFIVNPLQISALSDRTRAAVITFFSWSNLKDTFELNWICSANAVNFSQEAMSYGMWDIAGSWNSGHVQRQKVAASSTPSRQCKRNAVQLSTARSVSLSFYVSLFQLKLPNRNCFSIATGAHELHQLRCEGRRTLPDQAHWLDLPRIQEPIRHPLIWSVTIHS